MSIKHAMVAAFLAVVGMSAPVARADPPATAQSPTAEVAALSSDERPQSRPTESLPGSSSEVAQSPPIEMPAFPAGSDNNAATLGHIRWLVARSDARWEENSRQLRELRDEVAKIRDEVAKTRDQVDDLKTTAIFILGMILAAVIALRFPRREQRPDAAPAPANPMLGRELNAPAGN